MASIRVIDFLSLFGHGLGYNDGSSNTIFCTNNRTWPKELRYEKINAK